MSKVLLIMDEPKTCIDCVLCRRGACVVSECKKLDDSKFTKRAEFCPLRPVPDKKRVMSDMCDRVHFHNKGYNNCIDEILKE